MVKTFQTEAEDAEGHLKIIEGAESFAQVGLHRGAAGNTCDFVDRARNVGAVAEVCRLMSLEGFDGTDNRTLRVANWDSADAHRNFVSGLVVEKGESFRRLRSFDGLRQGAILAAEFAAGLIAVQQGFTNAAMADNFMPEAARDFFCARIPQNDSSLCVDNTESSRQIFQNTAPNLGIVEG